VRELGGIHVAIDVLRLDHTDGLLQFGRVDAAGRMVCEIRHHIRERLVCVNADAEGDYRDEQDGNAPKGVAQLHVMSLTEPLSPTLSPSGRGRC